MMVEIVDSESKEVMVKCECEKVRVYVRMDGRKVEDIEKVKMKGLVDGGYLMSEKIGIGEE